MDILDTTTLENGSESNRAVINGGLLPMQSANSPASGSEKSIFGLIFSGGGELNSIP